MNRYPWKLLIQAILEHGGVDINIRGLEQFSAEEIFEFPSVAVLRDIRLQVNNPDLSDSEKVDWIQSILG